MKGHRTSVRVAAAGLFVLGLTAGAAAQDAPASGQGAQPPAADQVAQGPLTVERIPSGWVVTPDVAVTQFNKDVGTLVGVYGGWLTERTWLVGAGGYWLANRDRDFKLAYGGFVLQYLACTNSRIGFGVKGLVGGGEATVGARFGDVYGTPSDTDRIRFGGHGPFHDGHRPAHTLTPDTRLVFDELIFIAEPQAQLVWNVTNTVRLTFGAGYRFTSGGRDVNDRISGPIGSVGVEFGGGN